MKKFIGILSVFAACIVVILGFTSGCGHHHRHHKHSIAVFNSSTAPSTQGNTVVYVQQPTVYDQDMLLNELLLELREFNEREEVINVTVEIDNNVDVDTSVVVEGDKIIVRPGKEKRVPSLYHWLKKFTKKKCDTNRCFENRPCDNED